VRPMILTELSREAGHPSLMILSDDDDLLARAGQIALRCGVKVTGGAIAPPHPVVQESSGGAPVEAHPPPGPGPAYPLHISGSLLFGPRAGFEKVFEVMAVSGDPDEALLARSIETTLAPPPDHEIHCGDRVLKPASIDRGGRPLIMGILNVTPDSFSDGGRFADPAAAIARGEEMAAQGADIIDVGGESTRPGSQSVPAEEEIRRVLPVIETLASRAGAPISIDTTKAEVARRAVAAGATIINDISGMTIDPGMPATAADLEVPVVLNHIRGVPRTMQDAPCYQHVVLEVLLDLAVRVQAARDAGVDSARIVIDPGIGFGKRPSDNFALLRHLPVFRSLGCPILVGVSRKSFLGSATGRPVTERSHATVAGEFFAALAGAEIIRTHDPAAATDALKMALSLRGSAVTR